jgi:hypothetical protein
MADDIQPQAQAPAEAPPQDVDELFPPRQEDVDTLFPPHVEEDHHRQVLRHGIQTGTISSRIQDMMFGEEGPVAKAAGHVERIGKAMWEKGAEGAEAGWESLAPSKETEETLTRHGLLNDYRKNEFSAIKAINRSIANAPAFVAAIGNGFFAGGQAGVAQLGAEGGAPTLGREIAALPEAFMGTPHPTGTPKTLPEAVRPGEVAKPDVVTSEVAKPAAAEPGAVAPPVEPTAATAPAEGGQAPTQEPQAPVNISRETPPAPPRDIHQVAHDIDPQTITADRDLAKRQEVMREWLSSLRDTRDRDIEEQAPHADEIAKLQAKIDDEDTTPRLRKKYQARLAPLIEERDAFMEDAKTGGDSPDMAKIRQRLQEVDYQRRDLAPAVTEAYRRAREIVPEEPEAAAGERQAGENDKQFAKRVVDKRAAPDVLPEEHDKYFVAGPDTITVPLDQLVSSKTDAENAQGAENGAKRMAASANGELTRRAPIDVWRRDDGTFLIVDGNGTYSSVKKYGWKTLPVNVVNDKYEPGIKAQGLNDSDALKKRWADTSPIHTIDDLYKDAAENKTTFDDVAAAIEKETGARFKSAPLKGRARVVEKVEKDGKAPSRINDVVRGGFIVDSPSQGDAIVQMMAKHFEVVDDGWFVTPAGYFDRKIIVRFPNGQGGEIQVWHPDMLKAKEETGHHLYVEWRSLPLDDPRRAVLDQQMRDLYEGALSGAAPEWKSLIGSGGNEGNLASNAALESTRPSIATSASSTRTHVSESPLTDQALMEPGARSSTNGSPSTEPNVSAESKIPSTVNVGIQAAEIKPPVNIATDVSDKLIAAGRPREEAEALGAIHQAYWETRAARFGGRKGTAAEMYAREAADIKAGPGVTPAAELPPYAAEPIPPRAVKGTGVKTAVNGVVDFAPGDLIVDAKRFQFKAGGDVAGMTDRLKGVTKWDPIKAGMVLVWQDREGKHYITDGHQRWNLARRIAAEDPAQNPRLNGWVVRESDGVTDAEVRAMAAAKNIAEGTGTAVDAAKVLRDHPALLNNLPPRSELVRQARALVNLNPNAFGMVVNEVVPPNYAAIVGDLVPRDFPMQDAILKLLAQIEPSNVTEAEAITRQAIKDGNAEAAKGAQGNLFGDSNVVNLYGVRAKVFARTMALLRRDKKVFAVLTKEQSLIESGGNKLAADVNERRAQADAQALQVLQTLANRTGPIADALNAAAKRAHGDGKYADAASDFAAAVRREAESGDLARLADGERRSGEHAGAEGEAGDVAPVDEARAQKANEQVLELLQIDAWHGSPHDFERFDSSKIGTGEGAQAYGHGLYFAENEGVAKRYKDDLTPTYYFENGRQLSAAEQNAASLLVDHKFTKQGALDYIENSLRPSRTADQAYLDKTAEAIRHLDPSAITRDARGALYKVTLKPDKADLLNWDKPLSEQSPKVQEAVNKVFGDWKIPDHADSTNGANIIRFLGGGEKASKALHDAGIPGIKYADQGSRVTPQALETMRTNLETMRESAASATGDMKQYWDRELPKAEAEYENAKNPTHNFVIFDDKDVEITHKNGEPMTAADRADAVKEMFQGGGDREVTKRGKIRLKPGKRSTIELLKDANASTFIHETGHDWLDRMMKDAEDGLAPDDLKADARTVLKWLGLEKAEHLRETTRSGKLTQRATAAHEKFADGFIMYMSEGRVPSRALANVFAKFKAWLFKVYELAGARQIPINDDIRGVFDRLLAIDPQPVTIVPEAEGIKNFADRHEAPLEKPAHVDDIERAREVKTERDKVLAAHHPEGQDERFDGIETGPDRRAAGGPEFDRNGNEARPDTREGGTAPQRGTLGPGGSEAPAETFASPGKAGPSVKTEPPAGPHEPFERDTGYVDKAGNIRLDTLNTEDDVKNVIRQTAADNGNFQDARGPIPDGMVIDLAESMGMDPSYLDTRKLGEAWTAPQIVALRNLLVRSATALKDAMVKASLGNEADVMAYAEAKARHRMIQERVSSVTAEAGRALRAFQRRFSAGMAEAQAVGDFLKDATGQTLFQLQQEAKYGSKLYTPEQVSKFVHDSSKDGFQEKIIFYYVNALISGPITHLRYSVGNAINAIERPLIEIPAAALSGTVRPYIPDSVAKLLGFTPNKNPLDRVYLGEAGAQLYALGKGSRDGLSAAIEAFKNGVSPPLPGERLTHAMELRQPPILGNILGAPGRAADYAIGVPGRSVSGIHSFFKSIRYEQEKAGLAYRQAMKENLTGDAFTNRVAQLEKDPTAPIMDAATKAALRELYMSPTEYSGFMGNLTRAVNQNLVAKIMAPFIKIGTQITRNAFVERTPLGLFSKEVRENVMGKGGDTPELTGTGVGPGAAQDVQVAKIAIGTALFGTAIGMAAEGLVTGDGPVEPDKRTVWLLSHRPNSMQVGGITIPYRGLGHLGMLMGFGANMYESAHAIDKEEEWATTARSFFEGISKSVLDENFMRGVKDALDALYHPQEYGERYIKQFVTNWIPFSVGLGQVAREVDPYQRETQTLLQTAQAKMPLLSEMLMPKRDMFGEPIETSARAQDKYKDDPVVKALDELHIGVGKLHRKIEGIELTDKQFDDYARIAGRTTKLMLNQMVSLPGWENIPPGIRIDMIHKTINKQRENAAKLIKALYAQDIVMPAQQKKLERMDKVPVH